VTRRTTPGTAGTVTTAPSVDDDFGDGDGYADDAGESSSSEKEGDEVIRVEVKRRKKRPSG
jgi:hypothetical protein